MRSRSIGIRAVTDTLRRSWLGRFLTSCGGASAVEFAMIVSVFVMILFGIMTAGWVFYLQNNLETAARAAARHMAVWDAVGDGTKVFCNDPLATALLEKTDCPTAGTCDPQPTAENVACTWFPQIARNAISVTAIDQCPADRLVVVRVEVAGSQAAILDVFGFFDDVTMNATVEMRREEEC